MLFGSGWHHGIEYLAPAAHVIVGHPPRQPHEVWRQQGFIIEHSAYLLDGSRGSIGTQADAETRCRPVPLAEGREHALAHGDDVAQAVGDGITVGMIERPVKDNIGKQADILSDFLFSGLEQFLLGGLRHRCFLENTCWIGPTEHHYRLGVAIWTWEVGTNLHTLKRD